MRHSFIESTVNICMAWFQDKLVSHTCVSALVPCSRRVMSDVNIGGVKPPSLVTLGIPDILYVPSVSHEHSQQGVA